MCAIRRQYSGEVKYCWPASCWPVLTSQRRNSAFSRPSPCRVMRPVTSACALMVFQFWKCGAHVDVGDLLDVGGLVDRREQPAALEIVGDDLGDADADLGIAGRARHEIRDRDRQRREFALGELHDALLRRTQRAERRRMTAPADAIPDMSCRRSGGTASRQSSCQSSSSWFCSMWPAAALKSVSFGEDRREGLPFVEIRRRQIIRLALDDRAQARSPDRRGA